MPPILSIRFQPAGRPYHFDAQGITDLRPGDRVVVETTRGRQLGTVIGYVSDEELEGRSCKPIERRATPRDLVMQQHWHAKALHALVTCRDQAKDQRLSGFKFVKAEYNFDGSQVTILYTTEKKRAELAPLQRNLRRVLRTKVELFQIGPRDLAKSLDGLGACGIQRCCSRYLTKFNSVSIRMAKLQQISLTPSEITGVCGRLRCCLAYEHDQYAEAAKGLPRRGKEVQTPYGRGRVVEVRTLVGRSWWTWTGPSRRPAGGYRQDRVYHATDQGSRSCLAGSRTSACRIPSGQAACRAIVARVNLIVLHAGVAVAPRRKRITGEIGPRPGLLSKRSPSPRAAARGGGKARTDGDAFGLCRILVMMAHPDDPDFFCGGTLARWTHEAQRSIAFWRPAATRAATTPRWPAGPDGAARD